MSRILREVLDALLLIVLLVSIAFLVYYLQIPAEDRPPLSDLIAGDTRTPTTAPTVTFTPAPFTMPPPVLTSTRSATPALTASPTSTPTSKRASVMTPTSTVQLSVDAEIAEGIKQGVQVVQAIEAYISAKGFYPSTLNDLVPDYLPELPLTITGQPFFYRVFERTAAMSTEIYWVSFRVVSQSNVTCTYYRRLQHWDCNFSSP